MERRWEEMADYPMYAVSNYGEIINIKTHNEISISKTQTGHLKVTLRKDGAYFTRSLAPLVARAFVPKLHESWDTPIHLDGDFGNCRADNLVWRPRWFAVRYHRQFGLPLFETGTLFCVDVDTGDLYHTVKDVCVTNGVYWHDVWRSYLEDVPVAITRQRFRPVEDGIS